MTDFEARLAQLRARFVLRAKDDAVALSGTNSRAELLTISHSLSGAAGTFGFPAISAAAQNLEEAIYGELADGELVRLRSELIARLKQLDQEV